MVRVVNRANGRSVTVRINDRGPFVSDRCLDLSRGAMSELGGISSGVITVDYQVLPG
jgi:rare lipoprotein A